MKSKWEATPHDYLQVVLNLSLLIGLLTANIQRLHQQLLLIQHSLKDKWRRSWSIVKEKKAKKNEIIFKSNCHSVTISIYITFFFFSNNDFLDVCVCVRESESFECM